MSRSSSAAGLLSGTKNAGRITDSTFSVDSPVAVLVDAARDVLEVDDAEDVVDVLADDRDAAEAAAQRQRHRLAQRPPALDDDHLGARHHDLAHDRVAELEDRVDHVALVVLDEPALLGEVDEVAQLRLGRERPVAEAAARRQGVAEHDEQSG